MDSKTQAELDAMDDMDEITDPPQAPSMEELLSVLTPEQLQELSDSTPEFIRISGEAEWEEFCKRHAAGEVLNHAEQDKLFVEFTIAANTVQHLLRTVEVMDSVIRREVEVATALIEKFGEDAKAIALAIHEKYSKPVESEVTATPTSH